MRTPRPAPKRCPIGRQPDGGERATARRACPGRSVAVADVEAASVRCVADADEKSVWSMSTTRRAPLPPGRAAPSARRACRSCRATRRRAERTVVDGGAGHQPGAAGEASDPPGRIGRCLVGHRGRRRGRGDRFRAGTSAGTAGGGQSSGRHRAPSPCVYRHRRASIDVTERTGRTRPARHRRRLHRRRRGALPHRCASRRALPWRGARRSRRTRRGVARRTSCR